MVKLFLRKVILCLRLFSCFSISMAPLQNHTWMYVSKGREYVFTTSSQWREWASLSLWALPSGSLVSKAVSSTLLLPALFAFTFKFHNCDSWKSLLCLVRSLKSSLCQWATPWCLTTPKPCDGACSDYLVSSIHIGTNCCPGKFSFKTSSCLSKWHSQVAFTNKQCIDMHVGRILCLETSLPPDLSLSI